MKLHHVDLSYDSSLLINELHNTKMYDSKFYGPAKVDTWLKGTVLQEAPEVNRLKNKLPNTILAAFFIQPAGTVVVPHKDSKCGCSLNILLNDADAPIIIEGEKFNYKCALINVSQYEHEVPASPKDRYLLRYTFAEPFEIIKPLLSNLS